MITYVHYRTDDDRSVKIERMDDGTFCLDMGEEIYLNGMEFSKFIDSCMMVAYPPCPVKEDIVVRKKK